MLFRSDVDNGRTDVHRRRKAEGRPVLDGDLGDGESGKRIAGDVAKVLRAKAHPAIFEKRRDSAVVDVVVGVEIGIADGRLAPDRENAAVCKIGRMRHGEAEYGKRRANPALSRKVPDVSCLDEPSAQAVTRGIQL